MKDKIIEILKGIDQDQCESDDGWWETSTGVEFGKKKLNEIIALFDRLTEQLEGASKAKIKDIWYGGHNFAKGCGLIFEHWYSLNKEKLQSNPITDSGGVSDVIEQIKEIVEYTPELNMGNYNHDEVKDLNDAMIEIHQIVLAFKKSHPTPDPKGVSEEEAYNAFMIWVSHMEFPERNKPTALKGWRACFKWMETKPITEISEGEILIEFEKKNNPFYPNQMKWQRESLLKLISWAITNGAKPVSEGEIKRVFEKYISFDNGPIYTLNLDQLQSALKNLTTNEPR